MIVSETYKPVEVQESSLIYKNCLPTNISVLRLFIFSNKVDAGLASRVSSEPDFNHIRIATPLFGVEFDEYTQNDVTLHIQPNYIKKTGKTDFPYYWLHTENIRLNDMIIIGMLFIIPVHIHYHDVYIEINFYIRTRGYLKIRIQTRNQTLKFNHKNRRYLHT